MFSAVDDTAGGTLSHKAYSPNILLQLPVKRLLQHVSGHQVSMVAMTTLYCLKTWNNFYYYLSLKCTLTIRKLI